MICNKSKIICFFKQKTAYEMRISDWRSDVCSSDLGLEEQRGVVQAQLVQRLAHRREIVRRHRQQTGEHARLHGLETRQGMVGRLAGMGQRVADRCAVHDRKSTRLNFSHSCAYRMPSSACNKTCYFIYHSITYSTLYH